MTAPPATTCELRQQGGLRVLTWPALDQLAHATPAHATPAHATPAHRAPAHATPAHPAPPPATRGAEVMVTTRHGGISTGPYATLNLSFSVGDDPGAVLENRQRVAAALGADLADFVFARQVHGGQAQVVSAAERGRGTLGVEDAIGQVDALVTRDPGTVLAILVGDCVPIVLYDPVAHVLAGVHAGWRGTVAGVSQAALAAMATLGSRPADVLAGIGPAIAPDRYQVGDDVRAGIVAGLGDEAAGVLRPDGTGRWLLDLWSANRKMLTRAGVPDSQIHVAAVPTGPDQPADRPGRPGRPGRDEADREEGDDTAGRGLFFSDRTARPCGRFALVARLTGGDPTATPTTGRRSR
ncbi:MAG TPA: polyphenol oxidase family protein [Streptosporangiaceae bacterium]|nr:polyphenol oxidase family protein [Streptosporangiaceae bacterium]